MARSVARSPSLDSRASAVAVTGLLTPLEMRVFIWPWSATGRSGVMLTVAAPTRSSAAPDGLDARGAMRVAAARTRRRGLGGVAVFISIIPRSRMRRRSRAADGRRRPQVETCGQYRGRQTRSPTLRAEIQAEESRPLSADLPSRQPLAQRVRGRLRSRLDRHTPRLPHVHRRRSWHPAAGRGRALAARRWDPPELA